MDVYIVRDVEEQRKNAQMERALASPHYDDNDDTKRAATVREKTPGEDQEEKAANNYLS